MIEVMPFDYVVENDVGIHKLMEITEQRVINNDYDIAVVAAITKYHNYQVAYTYMSLSGLLRKGFVYYLEESIFDDPSSVAFSVSILGPSNFMTVGMVKEPPNKFIRSSEYEIMCNEKVIINTIIKTAKEIGPVDGDSFRSIMNVRSGYE
jgi:hypothetical protein